MSEQTDRQVVDEAHPDESRCVTCGWTLARTREAGCVEGDCSLRPGPKVHYADRLRERIKLAAARKDRVKFLVEDLKVDGSREHWPPRITVTLVGLDSGGWEDKVDELRKARSENRPLVLELEPNES